MSRWRICVWKVLPWQLSWVSRGWHTERWSSKWSTPGSRNLTDEAEREGWCRNIQSSENRNQFVHMITMDVRMVGCWFIGWFIGLLVVWGFVGWLVGWFNTIYSLFHTVLHIYKILISYERASHSPQTTEVFSHTGIINILFYLVCENFNPYHIIMIIVSTELFNYVGAFVSWTSSDRREYSGWNMMK